MINYDKIFVLDTNIILNNAENLIDLSEKSKNLIVLPETVLDEIDSKKSGLDEINFQARQFARMLYDAKILNTRVVGDLSIVETRVQDVTILILSKTEYKVEKDIAERNIINDRKILEAAKDLSGIPGFKDLKFISLDVMARIRAISLGIRTEALNLGLDEVDADREFHACLDIPEYNGDVSEIPDQEPHISSVEIMNEKGRMFIYFKSNSGWVQIDDKNEKRLPVPPIDKRQKIMAELILDNRDNIIVVSGPAGTGKTLTALGAAMKLCDPKHGSMKKIYYIRRTVISGTKEDEVGFLPGSLEEKMAGYNQPMESALKKVAKLKKRDANDEQIAEMVEQFKSKYKIEYLYAGHLRGDNLEDDSILIIDEEQNFDITSTRTIISRVGKNSIVLALGSNNQIDSQFLTKNTNGLTHLMALAGGEYKSGVQVKGVKLTNVQRSPIAEFADEELY